MQTNEINKTGMALYARMEQDGYSKSVLETARWVIGHFEKYCQSCDETVVSIPLIARFLSEKYDIDLHEAKGWMQTILRRPLLMLIEFYGGGNYTKHHLKGSNTKVPAEHNKLFMSCRTFVNGMNIGIASKRRKLKFMADYILYLGRVLKLCEKMRPK